MNRIALFHVGYAVISEPDIHFGRKNADFGQGFYLSPQEEFACRWAKERRDAVPYLNSYELELSGLRVHTFARTADWYDYITRNRRTAQDAMPEVDVIRGPIANDTIYNTFGIFTSGLLGREESLRLLCLGPEYEQIVIKTERALAELHFQGARPLTEEELVRYRRIREEEERAYQELLAANMPEE